MTRHLSALLLFCLCMAPMTHAQSAQRLSFGVIATGSFDGTRDELLRSEMRRLDAKNLAFVVAQGILPARSQCQQDTTVKRLQLLERSQHGLIVSLRAQDWAICNSRRETSSSIAHLNRVRDLAYSDDFSVGATKLPLVRQSTEARFNSFVENVRWEIGNTVFATINVPSNNNNYIAAAGRNSEFEDREIANKEWLKRVFTYASLKQQALVVFFMDADIQSDTRSGKRDGYRDLRDALREHASEFSGVTLVIHSQAAKSTDIEWTGKLGVTGTPNHAAQFQIDTSSQPPVKLTGRR